jgi:hypothetical protein
MAAVRCDRCGAVVSARRVNGDVETSYGADFRTNCRELADRLGADFVSTAIECSMMAKFIERDAFRITEAGRPGAQVCLLARHRPRVTTHQRTLRLDCLRSHRPFLLERRVRERPDALSKSQTVDESGICGRAASSGARRRKLLSER